MNSLRQDRSVLVSGGTGLLGSWLVSQIIGAAMAHAGRR